MLKIEDLIVGKKYILSNKNYNPYIYLGNKIELGFEFKNYAPLMFIDRNGDILNCKIEEKIIKFISDNKNNLS